MKLHLPKQLFTALLAAITLATPAEAATYYLNATDSNDEQLHLSISQSSGGTPEAGNFWHKLCGSSTVTGYDGPHILVIDQARTETNRIKLTFSPLTVAALQVTSTASGTWIGNSDSRTFQIGDNRPDAASQASTFDGNLKLQGNGTELRGTQTWTIGENVKVELANGSDSYTNTLTNTGTATISGGELKIGGGLVNNENCSLTIGSALTVGGDVTNNGALTLSGAVGAADAALGTFNINKGSLEMENTSYLTTLNVKGGASLTFSGDNVTHTISGDLSTNSGASGEIRVKSGITLDVGGNIVNSWGWGGAGLVVDGKVEAGTLRLAYDRSAQYVSGTGEISVTKLESANNGSYYISVNKLSIDSPATGHALDISANSDVYLSSTTTTIAGTTSVASGTSLNFEAGTATLTGAVTNSGNVNVNGGSVTLNGGMSGTGTVNLSGGNLTFGSGENITNTIAQFNYSGGTLNHSGLTVTNATFSGSTLSNADNGTLTLNGTLTITDTMQLENSGLSYSGGSVSGNGYAHSTYQVISGGSIAGDFAVKIGETTLDFHDGSGENAPTNYATKSDTGLSITLGGEVGAFYVFGGEETLDYNGPACSYHVAEGAMLKFSAFSENGTALTKRVTGTGTVKVEFNEGNHEESVQFGDGFNGGLEVSGYMHLANFRLGKDATIKLVSGQVWNDSATTSAYKILLAGEGENSFSFIGSDLTLTGEVSGSYLTTSANMNLLNAANSISQVMVKSNTTNLYGGSYDTLKLEGGAINVRGSRISAVNYTGGGHSEF